ncbi:MAG: DMT family transporter [Pseudomonadota bacterium]
MVGLATKPNEDRPFAGIALVLVAYFLFSIVDTSSKWLGILGLGALQLSFMRYLGHFIITFGIMAKNGFGRDVFVCERLGLVIARSIFLMLATVMNFIAIRYLPLTITSTILFSAPTIVCVLAWPLLGERVGPWRWLAIGIGFVGILIVIRPFGESLHWAVFLSLGNALFFALYLILTRKLADVVASDTLQFYTGFVGTIALLPFGLAEWQNPQTGFDWIVLMGLGTFAWIGHGLLIRANNFAPASSLTPFGYSFILYLTIWSYFVFDDQPDGWTIVGACVVICSGLIIWAREQHLRRKQVLHGHV